MPQVTHHRFFLAATLGLLLMLLSGCAQNTRTASTWHGDRISKPADRILIVAVSNDLTYRRMFEDLVVRELAAGGNTAWASSRRIDTTATLNRESVAQAVRDTGATLVVVTRLAHQETEFVESREQGGIKARRLQATPLDFFRYDYTLVEPTDYLVAESAVSVATDVYGVESGGLVYSIDTSVPPRDTRIEIIDEAALAIAARLRRDGLVR